MVFLPLPPDLNFDGEEATTATVSVCDSAHFLLSHFFMALVFFTLQIISPFSFRVTLSLYGFMEATWLHHG